MKILPTESQPRSRLIAIASIVVVVLVSIVIVISRHGGVAVRNTYALPDIFSSATPYGDDSLLLSNGRALVAYNYQNGKTTQITPASIQQNLQDIDSISASPDKNYIVFHSQLANPGGVLGDILQQEGSDIYASYWWVYNTVTNTYHHFAQSTAIVKTNGDQAYVLEGGDSGQSIVTYSLNDFNKIDAIPVNNISDFFIAPHGFLLNSREGGGVLSTKDGVVISEIFKKTAITAILSDGHHAIANVSVGDKTAQLALLNLDNNTQNIIGQNIIGLAVANKNFILFNNTEKPGDNSAAYKLNLYSETTGKVQRLNLPKEAAGASTPVAIFDGTTYLVAGSANQKYLASSSPITKIEPVPSNYTKTITVDGSTVAIPYYPDQKAFLVTLDANNTQAEAQAVYKQLRNDGYNPDLLDIRFNAFTPPPVND